MQESMKTNILFTYANTYELGGADFCLLKLATALDSSKFCVKVALSKHSPIEKIYRENNIEVIILNMPRLQKTEDPIKLLRYLLSGFNCVLELCKIIKKENINIVHANDLLDIWGPIAARISRIKSIQHIRMILPKGIINRSLVRYLNEFVDRIVSVSKGTQDNLFGIKESKCRVIYDWLDPEIIGHTNYIKSMRDEYSISSDTKIIGIIGRLQWWKGQHLAIDAFNLVQKSYENAILVICGGEVHGKHKEYSQALISQVANLGISQKVIFTGYRSDVINILQNLDVFIHCSVLPDPLPGVVMEASFCKIPVIAPNAGGIPEEIIDGETGFLYSPGNLLDLSQKIIEVLNLDLKKIEEIGEKGNKLVSNKFNKELLCEEFEALYQELV
jgi:glycosyltransferase involved in cell wall biosynthesis